MLCLCLCLGGVSSCGVFSTSIYIYIYIYLYISLSLVHFTTLLSTSRSYVVFRAVITITLLPLLISVAQALDAAEQAYGRFTKEKIPFRRPNDYFAEMVKSDKHMANVR
jgi:uncharacterized membrane protein